MRGIIAAGLIGLGALPSASASFHLMQIEQVIGGVNGVASVQAIQLRMRSVGQSLVSFTRVRAWDATGANPVLLKDITSNVSNSAAGSRVLLATTNFAVNAQGLTPDSIMSPIPASYLAGGKITFEDDSGTIYWSLAFGAYTGTNLGSITNDADGNFGAPFASPLPSATKQALAFAGAATDLSTNNASQYALTAGVATFRNNAGTTGIINVKLGDANLDGAVNSVDFGILLANFGGSGKTWGDADFDASGKVNSLDFNILAGQFGSAASLPGTIVPEPGAFGAILLPAIVRRSRREANRWLPGNTA